MSILNEIIKVYQSETDTYIDMKVIGKYKYIGDDEDVDFIKGKIYYRVEPDDEFRIVDETEEDYLYSDEFFEEIEVYEDLASIKNFEKNS